MNPLRLLLATMLAGLLVLGGSPLQASAQTEDRIEQMQVRATVRADGSLQVSERIDYRLAGAGRHGIVRELVLTDTWDARSDVHYQVGDIQVSTNQGSAEFTAVPVRRDRHEYLQLRIGSKDHEIAGTRQQVQLSYTISGTGYRSQGEAGQAERVRWTVLDHSPAVERLQVQVQPAEGAVRCTSEPAVTCSDQGNGQVLADQVPRNARLRLDLAAPSAAGATTQPQATTTAAPIPTSLVARQGWWIALLLVLVGAIAGRIWATRAAHDEPVSEHGDTGDAEGRQLPWQVWRPNDLPDIPGLPIAEAAVLLTGRVGARHSLATLLDLAGRGWLTVGEAGRGAELRRSPNRGRGGLALHEQLLLDSLFATDATVELTGRTSLGQTQRRFERSVLQQVANRHWFGYRHWGLRTVLATTWGLALLLIGALGTGGPATWLAVLAIGVAPVLGWQTHRFTGSPSGRRTALAMGHVGRLEQFWQQLELMVPSPQLQDRCTGWRVGLAGNDLDSTQRWQVASRPSWWIGPWRTDAVDELLVLWMAACARKESPTRGRHVRTGRTAFPGK